MESAIRVMIIFSMIVLTMVIFYKSKFEKTRIKLGLLSLSITYWIISFEMLRNSQTYISVSFWAKSIFIAAPTALIMMFSLSRDFREYPVANHKIHSRIMYFIYILIVVFIAFSEKIISIGNPEAESITAKAPVGNYFVYCMLFYFYLTSNYFLNLILAYKKNPNQRVKVFYMALSTLLTLTVTLLTTGVLPILGAYEYVWLGPYSTSIFIVTLTYSVLRYRLFDIDLLVRRLAVIIVLSMIILICNAVLVIMLGSDADPRGHTRSIYIITINLLLMVIIYFNHDNIEKIAKGLFMSKKQDYISSLIDEVNGLREYNQIDELIDGTNRLFTHSMEVTGTAIYLKNNAKDEVYVKKTFGIYDHGFPDDIRAANDVMKYIKKNNKVIDKGELKHRLRYNRLLLEEKNELKQVIKHLDNKYNCSVVVPFNKKGDLLGAAFLQSKKSGYQYSNSEIFVLKTLSLNLATLLDNILLQEKTVKNEKMALIGAMASSFAHEIRNPLTSVSTYLGMLPRKLDNKPFLEKFFAIVPKEIARVSKLTTDMLNFSRSNQSNPVSVDVGMLIESVVELVKNEAGKKNVNISVQTDEDNSVIADDNQLYQVLLNMVINSIHASASGQEIKIFTFDKQTHLEIEIQDQGEGIEQEHLYKIFEPFYSTKIYGTGLGLATCKRIIESHGGTILVNSQKNAGSTFTIIIPKTAGRPEIRVHTGAESGMIG